MTDAQRAFDERQRLAKKRQRERSTKRKRVDPAMIEKVSSERCCRVCRTSARRVKIDVHHIVHRGKIGRDHPERDHPDNGMALCHDCHMGHHDGTVKVWRHLLSASEVAFILRHVGEGYLDRQYPVEA